MEADPEVMAADGEKAFTGVEILAGDETAEVGEKIPPEVKTAAGGEKTPRAAKMVAEGAVKIAGERGTAQAADTWSILRHLLVYSLVIATAIGMSSLVIATGIVYVGYNLVDTAEKIASTGRVETDVKAFTRFSFKGLTTTTAPVIFRFRYK